MRKSSLFLTSLQIFLICCFFDSSHSDRHEVILHCNIDLHLPVIIDVKPIFSDAYWQSVCFLRKNVYSGPLPIFQSDCFPDVELYVFFICFGY